MRKDDIGDGAVVGAVLAGAAGDHPAAHAAVLEALGEVAAGILALCAEAVGGVLQGLLQHGAGKPRLHGDGLIHLIEADDLIKALSHIQRNAALDGLHAAGDRAAAAVNIQRDMVLCRIADDLFHLLGGIGVDHHIRQAVDLLMAQPQKVIAGAAVGHRKPGVVIGRDKFLADDLPESLQMLRGHFRGVIGQLHPVKADVIGIVLKVVIGHVKGLFHQLVERLLGIFEEFGVAPPEDGTVAALRGGGQQPLGFKAFVRFIAHNDPPYLVPPASRRSR